MLYLHVGSHKTGTSSIQATFHASREHLARNGVDYFGYSENHSAPMLWRFGSKRFRHPATVQAGLSKDDVRRVAAEIDRELRVFLADGDRRTKVISGEEMSTLPREDVDGLAEYVLGFGIPVRVILYVRNYYEWLNSQLQELVAWGWTLPALEQRLRTGDGLTPDYKGRIEKFVANFGPDSVDVRLFDREGLAGGDLLLDFCHAIQAPAVFDGLTKREENVSLAARSIRLFSDYVGHHPRRPGDRLYRARADAARRHLLRAGEPKFRLADTELLALYSARIADDAAYLRDLVGADAAERLLLKPAETGPDEEAGDPLRGDYDELMSAFGQAVKESVDQADVRGVLVAGLALAARVIGGHAPDPAALEAVRGVFQTAGGVRACLGLGRALLRAGRPDYARLAAERIDELEPGNPEGRKLLEAATAAAARPRALPGELGTGSPSGSASKQET